MNLFGSISSSKHILIVHDLVSIFPAAKLFTIKKCTKVTPALTEKYTITLGTHKYRYQTMGQHSTALNWSSFSITLQKILPVHPSSRNHYYSFERNVFENMFKKQTNWL